MNVSSICSIYTKDKRQIEAGECFLLLRSTVLAQQTVQEQTDLKEESLMEPALPGKYSIMHLVKPLEHLCNTNQQNGLKKASRIQAKLDEINVQKYIAKLCTKLVQS